MDETKPYSRTGRNPGYLQTVKMAKSLRSKWKRKMKAVKRVKYGEREKKKLEKIVANAEERKKLLDEEHQPQPLGKLTFQCSFPEANKKAT